MAKNLLVIRIIFLLLCAFGSWLISITISELAEFRWVVVLIGVLIGTLVVLVDILLKGFSVRGLTALTFGLGVGALVSFLIGSSPLFEEGDPEMIFLARLSLFVICSYLGAVIALRGKDEFNLVIPYVRFVPHGVDSPLIVVDTSALIDGRIARICQTHFISSALVIPRFVLSELQRIADSTDPVRKAKGRRGLQVLSQLKQLRQIEVRVEESEVGRTQDVDAKLIFLATALKGKLLTIDYNLAKLAEFHGIPWLNINDLTKALSPEYVPGEVLVVQLVKTGKEPGQAVGFMGDGSMIVVADAVSMIGKETAVEVVSMIPTGAGKMVFAKLAVDFPSLAVSAGSGAAHAVSSKKSVPTRVS